MTAKQRDTKGQTTLVPILHCLSHEILHDTRALQGFLEQSGRPNIHRLLHVLLLLLFVVHPEKVKGRNLRTKRRRGQRQKPPLFWDLKTNIPSKKIRKKTRHDMMRTKKSPHNTARKRNAGRA